MIQARFVQDGNANGGLCQQHADTGRKGRSLTHTHKMGGEKSDLGRGYASCELHHSGMASEPTVIIWAWLLSPENAPSGKGHQDGHMH